MPPFPPSNQICFIDANVLYYDIVTFPGVSEYCSDLILQIMSRSREAATISNAVADAVHKVMCSEAVEFHHRSRQGLLPWIKKHPEAILPLTKSTAAAKKFIALPLRWLPTDSALLRHAVEISVKHGLTINDALIVAAMNVHGIEHLVTNDDDFNRIPKITIWIPR